MSLLSRLPLTAALLAGLLPVALLDTGLLLAFQRDAAGVVGCLWLSAYLLGQRAALVLLLALVREGWARVPRRVPSWLTSILVFGLAFGLMTPLLEEDLENQAAWSRPLYVAAMAVVPVVIVGARSFLPWRAPVRVGLALVALALAVANHVLLLLNYPGFHVICVTLTSLAAGLSLASDDREPSKLGRVHAAAAVALVASAVWAIVIPPPTRLSSQLVTQDALSLHRFTAGLFHGREPLRVSGAKNPYARVTRESRRPPGPPLLPRESLIVVLVTVDALRYDAVSGQYPISIPTLKALFAEGTRFANAAVPAVSTTNSIVSLFTGRYYPQIDWRDESTGRKTVQIPELRAKRFPQSLARAGVNTFLGATNWRFLPQYKAALGFKTLHKANLKGYPHAEEVLPALVKWVGENKKGPAFAYTHLVDVHWPYDRGGTHGTEFEAYLREVEVLDRELGKMIAGLKEAGVWDKTILIVSADHGEAFGEHGQNRHDGWLYQELTHVPLVIRVPGQKPRTFKEPVSTIDLGPTILDLFGLEVPGGHMGESLVPILRGQRPRFERPVALYSKKGQGGILFPDLVKVLYIPRLRQAEVYDLKVDPKETVNLADEKWAAERVAKVRGFFASIEAPSSELWRR